MIIHSYSLWFLILSWNEIDYTTSILLSDGPECHECQNVAAPSACNKTLVCSESEICYLERSSIAGGTVTFTLGCKEEQECRTQSTTNAPSPVGRSVRVDRQTDTYCLECCSDDLCNDRLCSNNSVDGNWAQWTAWTVCDVTCDNGTRSRSRSCTNPPPAFGGADCAGNKTETKSCRKPECPVDGVWSQWTAWTVCDVTCDNGTRSRSRNCTNPAPAFGGADCAGNETETKSCQNPECPVNGVWGQWTEWTVCDVTCDNGTRSRSRNCTNPATAFGGADCAGNETETKSCHKPDCSVTVDGNWAQWSEWADCDVTCDNGTTSRSRNCTNPAPGNGGADCSGNMTETKTCHMSECPVTIATDWGLWSDWSPCSVTCDIGIQKRNRTCLDTTAGTDTCSGEAMEDKICMDVSCSDGGWSEWGAWGTCSASCGMGLKRRERQCDNPVPSAFGRNCLGTGEQVELCRKNACVDGAWSEWGSWGVCSTTCGAGLRHRRRQCDNPSPSRLGKNCLGNMDEAELCYNKPCPDGGWSAWHEWGGCSVTCGAGIKHRQRFCDNPVPAEYSRDCQGHGNETDMCHEGPCESVDLDCYELVEKNMSAVSGVYYVTAGNDTGLPDLVYCDMDTDGGGWTVFQRRFNGSVDFYRTFAEYEYGFGDLNGEFWLGLTFIRNMTAGVQTELRIDLVSEDGTEVYEFYENFTLSEAPDYKLLIEEGNGTAGDNGNGLLYHRRYTFHTKDKDDRHDCAVKCHSGWWFNWCAKVNLNGNYEVPGSTSAFNSGSGGIIYTPFRDRTSLKETKMMFRRMG